MWRKGNAPVLFMGVSVGTITVESYMEVPQNIKIELLYGTASPLLGINPEKTKI